MLSVMEKLTYLRHKNIVLGHDWLVTYRGGERVLEVFCELFPSAVIYTLFYKKKSQSLLIESHPMVASLLDKIPQIHRFYRYMLPFIPFIMHFFKVKKNLEDKPVDLLLTSSHCAIKNLKIGHDHKNNHNNIKTVYVSYIHSPMRYLYDQYPFYFGKNQSWWIRIFGYLLRPFLQKWDQRSHDHVSSLIANSSFVQKRIQKYYGRSSEVIHPFVDLEDFKDVYLHPLPKKKYMVMCTAFAPNKRVDLAIMACNQSQRHLKIIGSGQQEEWLRSLAGPHIEFLGSLNREEVIACLAQAQALLFPGVEDFGIVPLESLAAGTPVIAFEEGGVLETLNQQVAVFFKDSSVTSLMAAMEQCDHLSFDREIMWKQAEKFSKENFKNQMIHYLYDKVAHSEK